MDKELLFLPFMLCSQEYCLLHQNYPQNEDSIEEFPIY